MLSERDVLMASELEDELKLVRNCESTSYKKTIRLLDLYMKMSSMRLTYSDSDRESEIKLGSPTTIVHQVKDTVTLANNKSEPPKVFPDWRIIRAFWRQLGIRPIWWAFLGYVTLKYMLMTGLRFEHDIIIKRIVPRIAENSTVFSEKCVLIGDIYFEDPKLMYRLELIKYWMSLMGDPAPLVIGFPLIMFLTCSAGAGILYLLHVYHLANCKEKWDHLSFIYNPILHRQKMRHKLGIIVNNIISRLANHRAGERLFLSSNIPSISVPTELVEYKETRLNTVEHHKLIKIISTIYHSNLVVPENLTSKWHKDILLRTKLTLPFLSSCYFLAGLTYMISLVGVEIYLRIRFKFDLLECRKWRSAAISTSQLNDRLILYDQFRETKQNFEIYEKYDGSLGDLMRLAFIELRNYLNFRRFITILEMSLMHLITINTFWGVTGPLMFKAEMSYRITWLDQIYRQLDDCRARLYTYKTTSTTRTNSVGKCSRLNNEHPMINDYDEYIIKPLIITYLNYLLFKNNYNKFKSPVEFIMLQHFLFMFLLMIIGYFVGTNIDMMALEPIFVGLAIFTAAINSYLTLSSHLFMIIVKIMKNIDKLMIYSIDGPQNLLTVLDLWRMQLMNTAELQETFALNLLGGHVHSGALIAYNGNIVTLWLLLIMNCRYR